MPTTPADAVFVQDLAAMLLAGDVTHDRIVTALRVATMRGYMAATEAEIERVKAQLAPVVEFPIPPREIFSHVDDALVRGLKVAP